jgi:hypothetical protein
VVSATGIKCVDQLDSRGIEFDVRRLSGHVTAGPEALAQADPEHAVSEFDAALVLGRGPVYVNLDGATWAAISVSPSVASSI